MEKGTVLFTKDGTKIGNAIIISDDIHRMQFINGRICEVTYYTIVTNYGNVSTLNEERILELFTVGDKSCLKTHFECQKRVLERNIFKKNGIEGECSFDDTVDSLTYATGALADSSDDYALQA